MDFEFCVCDAFSGVGVYISRVEEGSVAERAGLRPGDSILEVNGTPFTGISHEEALKVQRGLLFCVVGATVMLLVHFPSAHIKFTPGFCGKVGRYFHLVCQLLKEPLSAENSSL